MKLLQNSRLRRAVKYLGDVALLTAAYYGAFNLRFDGTLPDEYWHLFAFSAPLVVPTKVILLYHFGLYRYFWRHTGIPELTLLGKALSLASLFIIADYAIAVGFVTFPRSIILFDWCLSLLALAAFRSLPRLLRDKPVPGLNPPKIQRKVVPTAKQNVLLYGAGDLGASLAEQIKTAYSGSKRVLGFIDDDPTLRYMSVHGFEVLGGRSVLPKVVARYGHIDQIVITISAISGRQLDEIVELCRQYSPNVQVAPSLDELFMGKVSVSDLRDVQIGDLLGRESAKVDFNEERMKNFLGGKTILVTGAGGSIGSELCFQILKFRPRKIILLGRGENSIYATKHRLLPHADGVELEEVIGDIINYSKLERVFKQRRPELIFHAAADKHVPLMELYPDEAVLNNIIGTQNVLTAALDCDAQKVVCISSDKAVNPSSVMGCCKRVTELLVRSPRFSRVACAVRFGNVMDSRGSVIPLFKKQIAEGGPITITDPNITRYFMTIPEAVLLVLQAGSVSRAGETFLLDMGQPIRLLDLARQMVKLSGLRDEDIPVQFIGLRPGEKLEEELSYPYETLLPTDQPKLSRLDGPSRVPADLSTKVQQLKMLGISMDFDEIQRTLQEVVPEYRPMIPIPQAARLEQSPALAEMQTTTLAHSERVGLSPPPLPMVAALVAALIWTYWLVIPGLVAQWWNEDEYSHGFLIPIVSGYLVWTKRDELKATPVRPAAWGLLVMVMALAIYVTGIVGADLFLQRVSMIFMIAGGLLYVVGLPILRVILFPLGFLLLMIPLPGIIFNSLAFPLQLIAAQIASTIMEACGVLVFREGNVMHLAAVSLDVEEACSGIRSLMSLTALGMLYAYIAYSSWLLRLLLLLAIVPIAIAANVFRVTMTGLLAHYVSVDTALGAFHTAGGWSVFIVAGALLLGVSRLLRMLVAAK